jgi:putative aldouronate transport system permease protein
VVGRRWAGSSRIANAVIVCLVTLVVLLCLLPMMNVVAMSFSSSTAILMSRVGLWPVEPTLLAYRGILSDETMVQSLLFTIALTLTYTTIAMLLTTFAAYAFTKKRLKGRNVLLGIMVFTMYFSGGIIPDYLLVRDLGMIDTFWALVFPGVMSVYNLIVLRTFFHELPESFEESAVMDGANEIQVLFRIVVPLSMPVLATISLFYAVGKWNSFMDALFYINSRSKQPIQLRLYQIIMQSAALETSSLEGAVSQAALPESVKPACIVFATVPILLAYPWLQRYFIKGVMIGGIKE